MKKNLLYLLGLTFLGAILVFLGLPTPYDNSILKSYAMGYLTILSGPLSVWFSSSFDMLFKLIATSVGFLTIATWIYMVRKESSFWKILIAIVIWVGFGTFILFAEITSHI